ncbi:MAG: hypothetical protein ABI847_16240 [Anaerolineales bacterium]
MDIRIQLSRQTVKAMQRRLQDAYRRDDTCTCGKCRCVRLVRRIQALLDHLVNGVPVAVVSGQWGFSPACFYEWLTALILDGLDSLRYASSGGRKAKLTPTQKKRLGDLIDDGPEAAGFRSGCWTLRGSCCAC